MELKVLENRDLEIFKHDMQEAFQLGAMEGDYKIKDDEIILPFSDIDASLNKEGAIAYKAVLNNEIIGGAIVIINEETKCNHLDFLYVKNNIQSKGVGRFIFNEIEKRHKDTLIWKTCTPYFEVRNIHFYVNVCHFHIVEFLNSKHANSEYPEEFEGLDDGMFVFEKRMK